MRPIRRSRPQAFALRGIVFCFTARADPFRTSAAATPSGWQIEWSPARAADREDAENPPATQMKTTSERKPDHQPTMTRPGRQK